jgi:hypothetical protein
MDSSRVISVAAFFVAGLVIAVGSALIYSTAHGLRRPAEPDANIPHVQPPAPSEPPPVAGQVDKPGASAIAHPERKQSVARAAVPSRPKTKAKTRTAQLAHSRLPSASLAQRYGASGSKPVTFVPAHAFAAPLSPVKPRPRSADTSTMEVAHQTPTTSQPGLRNVRPEQYALASQVSPPQAHVFTLEAGTAITIELSENVSTDYANTSDAFRGVLAEPVVASGFVVADRGSTVVGRIEYAHRARLFGGESELVLALTEIRTNDSHAVAVQTDSCEQTGARTNVTKTAKIAAGMAVGAVMGAVSAGAKAAGFSSALPDNLATDQDKINMHRSVVLPTGTKLTFHLARPLMIAND